MVTPTEPTEDGAEAQAVTAEVTTEAETTARTFSQEEVNRMMAQTRKDTRGQFADYNDLKQRAARADELEQAQLSESEKLAQRAADAEKAAEAEKRAEVKRKVEAERERRNYVHKHMQT